MKRPDLTVRPEPAHLPLSLLRRYQEGVLPAAEEHRVEKHLLQCGLCADILAGMTGQSATQTAAAVQEISRRVSARVQPPPATWQLRRHLRVAAAVLLLVTAGMVGWYNLDKVRRGRELPETTAAVGPPPAPPVLRPATPGTRPPAAPPPAAEKEEDPNTLAQARPLSGPRRRQPPPAPPMAADAAAPNAEAARGPDLATAPAGAAVFSPDSGRVAPAVAATAPGRQARVAARRPLPPAAALADAESVPADSLVLSHVVVYPGAPAGPGAQPAIPQGGWQRFNQYIQARPPAAGEPPSAGRVGLAFTVQADGSLAAIRVTAGLSPATDAEALRLLQQGPRWQPARLNQQPVAREVHLFIRFRRPE